MAEEKRSNIAHYLNTTPSATNPTYDLMGLGINELTANYNPSSSSETYVHQDVATFTVDRYEPNIPVEMTVYSGDPVFNFIDAIRQGGPTIGGNDLTQIVEVRKYETPDTAGTSFPATRWEVAIQIDSFGGAGGEKAKINFTLNIKGAGVDGDFNISTEAFTPT